MKAGKYPVTLQLDVDKAGLKRVVEDGRLLEFADALSTLASRGIRQQLVEQIAEAAVGVREKGAGIKIVIGFDVDDPYGTGPKPGPFPWPWPIWQHGFLDFKVQLRELVQEEIANAQVR